MNIQVPKIEMSDALDVLCPMHVQLDAEGRISHVGPTLQKLQRGEKFENRPFFEVFKLLRPIGLKTIEHLITAHGERIHLRIKRDPDTVLQGVVIHDPTGSGTLINLSFGISVLDAVRRYDLTNTDFSATDLTIELLFLVEAKSAAMEASRSLNERLERARNEAQTLASTDSLTGLKNRRAVEKIMSRKLLDCAPFSLMQLDLDYFKVVNDTYGHAAGDRVLQRVAQILTAAVREQDHVARIGGDEFVIILHGDVSKTRIAEISENLIEQLNKPIPYEGNHCKISASIGVSQVEESVPRSMDQVMQEADRALYLSKDNGRSQFVIFDDPGGESSGSP
ncbi:MAG: GGDEF domain-containing protein [Cognatishimia sp.]|uniref:GGDEF domain-containing protein n=1 Tax=Cognatishimia sp. TaxID=2211648 RepID=UPI003B8DF74D